MNYSNVEDEIENRRTARYLPTNRCSCGAIVEPSCIPCSICRWKHRLAKREEKFITHNDE